MKLCKRSNPKPGKPSQAKPSRTTTTTLTAAIEIPPDLPHQKLPIPHLPVLGPFPPTPAVHTLPQRPDPRPKIRLEEKRHADSKPLSAMHDPVPGTLPQPVRPPLHHVADVDHEGAGDGVGVDPGTVAGEGRGGLDLEGVRGGVGEEEG